MGACVFINHFKVIMLMIKNEIILWNKFNVFIKCWIL